MKQARTSFLDPLDNYNYKPKRPQTIPMEQVAAFKDLNVHSQINVSVILLQFCCDNSKQLRL